MPTSFNSRPVVAERLAAGTRLGPYEVRTFLGAGGMGAVYRAHDVRLGRDVALKVLPEAVRADATWQARLEREARAAAAINHPNVLALHDVGVHAGAPYLVCELLDGETLRTKLERGPLSAARALQWAQQIAHGLPRRMSAAWCIATSSQRMCSSRAGQQCRESRPARRGFWSANAMARAWRRWGRRPSFWVELPSNGEQER